MAQFQSASDAIIQKEYNQTAYQSFPFSNTHPSHLFTLATLFGLQPTPIEKARVLELGCASGGNLTPIAHEFPDAQFVGIDLAENQVNEGLKNIAALKLTNLQLKHQSIMEFGKQDGKFDYIICHGVYSWVNDEIQNKILSICRKNLTSNGIAYISYNTFPGWNMVNSVKDLMLWHTQNIQDPNAKVQQARSILKFIAEGLEGDQSPYAAFLQSEINLLSNYADYYLLHEHLSFYNQPCYFYQFMEKANQHQLSYLSDADLPNMFPDNLPPVFANELRKITNIISSSQYMDFIRNQRFRCTLLCHQEQQVNRALKTTDVESFYLQLTGKPDIVDFSEKDISEEKDLAFTHGTITLKVRPLLSQWALFILFQHQKKPIHYNELCEKISIKSGEKDINVIKQHLNDNLNIMRIVLAGLISISSYPGKYTLDIADKPVACALARYQAKNYHLVTNRRHQPISLDAFTKLLLPSLDGTRDLKSLMKIARDQISEGKITLLDKDKQPIKDHNEVKQHVEAFCKNALIQMAEQALLIPSEKDKEYKNAI